MLSLSVYLHLSAVLDMPERYLLAVGLAVLRRRHWQLLYLQHAHVLYSYACNYVVQTFKLLVASAGGL